MSKVAARGPVRGVVPCLLLPRIKIVQPWSRNLPRIYSSLLCCNAPSIIAVSSHFCNQKVHVRARLMIPHTKHEVEHGSGLGAFFDEDAALQDKVHLIGKFPCHARIQRTKSWSLMT